MSRIDRALNPDLYQDSAPDRPAPAPDSAAAAAAAVRIPSAVGPDVLFVPAHLQHPPPDAPPGSRAETVFELLGTPDGAVPVAFTTLDLLVDRLGPAQPWAAVPAEELVRVMDRLGIGPVHLDPAVDPRARRWTAADLSEYQGMV